MKGIILAGGSGTRSPKTTGGHNYYHYTEALADDAVYWLRDKHLFAGQAVLDVLGSWRGARPVPGQEGLGR